jgi:hypothetical protein
MHREKGGVILIFRVFFAIESEVFVPISHTNLARDTCLNGTLAFPDHKRSEVGGEPTII